MSESAGGLKAGGGVCRTRSNGRKKGKKNKVRASPFPTRLHHHPLPSRSGENVGSVSSPGSGDSQPARAAHYRQLRREVFLTKAKSEKKTVKSEKNSSTTAQSPAAHRCEQRNHHKQKNRYNLQHAKTNSPRKMDKLKTDSELSNSSVRKTDKKPLTSAENVQNIKPRKEIFTTDDKEINYAGAKFNEPPSPSVLPKPPSHWMDMSTQHSNQCKELMTYHLKTLLKVQS
ncbi:proline-rich nuclear receptor coactivator 1 [Hyperolius riggenbachi]|uniref:proline-rich nuclear receptor coactivator 1 n=1 Tax=Hyperolius riggenbachi TaxID=752182 RepID=UPI0035A2C1A7